MLRIANGRLIVTPVAAASAPHGSARQRSYIVRLARLGCAVVCLAIAGCGGTQVARETAGRGDVAQPAIGKYKVGQPYEVDGRWYYPKADYDYNETGIASWYGPKFHGQTTANGETFNQNALTAAHPTLPMPSMVKVTNLENGRQLEVRINDRGPYARGRIIDVSARAAELLGFKDDGTAKVRVQMVEGDSRRLAAVAKGGGADGAAPRPAPTGDVERARLGGDGAANGASARVTAATGDGGGVRVTGSIPRPSPQVTYVSVDEDAQIFIQAGAFVEYPNARRLSAKLAKLGPTRIEPAKVDDRTFYRVRMGPMADVAAADTLLADLAAEGHPEAEVVVD
jgi:rare lipoprotein A